MLLLRPGFLLGFFLHDFFRLGRDDAVFGWASDDLDGDVRVTGKQKALTDSGV